MDDTNMFDRQGDAGEYADISRFSEDAYLAYAMSVVKGRALPSIQDGMKPVQRRILFAMHEMGLDGPGTSKVKSARVVGEVLGKYHPHGDSSAYEAAVLQAQDFKVRYPLIAGQGNFGSRDGDSAAAMRYTEMRLSPIAELLLSEIDRGTVDFKINYDGNFQEPELLPARLPMLLLNGVAGVAVGFACNILPHNIREIGAAALATLDNEDPLLQVTGPDFPGGAQVINSHEDLRNIYETGRGSVRLRARWTVEHMARGQWRVIVHELPHDSSAERVIGEMEELANPKIKKDKKALDARQVLLKQTITNLVDEVRNESKKQIRLIIEPKNSKVDVDEMMNFLLANTSMEESYTVNMTVVDMNGKPRLMGLPAILKDWVDFRKTTVRRRCQFDLDKVNRRIHIWEGRHIAFLNIDEVIRIIRNSDDPKVDLMARFSLTEIQAEDILEIRLRQLARLEGIKIENELKQMREEAGRLEAILASETKLRNLVRKEIEADVARFGDERRTLIEPVERSVASIKSLVTDEPVTIILSKNGWIRSRQGHGLDRSTITWKPGDTEFAILETRTTLPIVLMDNTGRAYSIDAADVPGGKGDGVPVTSMIELQNGNKLICALSGNLEDKYFFATSNSYGFIAPLKNLVARPRAGKAFQTVEDKAEVFVPIRLDDRDHLVAVSSENKMLVFPLVEMKELPSGGKGVIIMDIPDNATLSRVKLCDGKSVTITIKGKDKVVDGANLMKYLLHRARKGCMITVPEKSSGGAAPADKPIRPRF